jgi:hypothetical protein
MGKYRYYEYNRDKCELVYNIENIIDTVEGEYLRINKNTNDIEYYNYHYNKWMETNEISDSYSKTTKRKTNFYLRALKKTQEKDLDHTYIVLRANHEESRFFIFRDKLFKAIPLETRDSGDMLAQVYEYKEQLNLKYRATFWLSSLKVNVEYISTEKAEEIINSYIMLRELSK